mmetsp:Transcript_14272/g.19854  ORF Transcript_14272/g.19854 Transcript_14272/m.19854 type:complete len:199 (-) Transcript_14272:129-725(-)
MPHMRSQSSSEESLKQRGLVLTKQYDRKIPVNSSSDDSKTYVAKALSRKRKVSSKHICITPDRTNSKKAQSGLDTRVYAQTSKIKNGHSKVMCTEGHAESSGAGKVHVCTYCLKRFKKKSSITSHIRVHTNERPYPCPYCPRRFKHVSNLTCHEQMHTGNWRFKCNLCLKGYPRKDRLLKHMKTVHPFPIKTMWFQGY